MSVFRADQRGLETPAESYEVNGLAVGGCWPAAMPSDDPPATDGMADVAKPGFLPLSAGAYDRKRGARGRWPFRTASRSQGQLRRS
jgi:hypothetical protein